jgi:hypothetical protein
VKVEEQEDERGRRREGNEYDAGGRKGWRKEMAKKEGNGECRGEKEEKCESKVSV